VTCFEGLSDSTMNLDGHWPPRAGGCVIKQQEWNNDKIRMREMEKKKKRKTNACVICNKTVLLRQESEPMATKSYSSSILFRVSAALAMKSAISRSPSVWSC